MWYNEGMIREALMMMALTAVVGCTGTQLCEKSREDGAALLQCASAPNAQVRATCMNVCMDRNFSYLVLQDREDVLRVLKNGRVSTYCTPKVEERPEASAIEFEVKGTRVRLEDIWSESREQEELKRVAATGCGPKPPVLVVPDADYAALEAIPYVQKTLREERRIAPLMPYLSVLRSAKAAVWEMQRKDEAEGRPMLVFIKYPQGLGATPQERLQAFLKLYELGESVELTDDYAYTGAGYACKLGDLETLKLLVQKGVNLRHGEPHHGECEDCECCVGEYMPSYVELALRAGHRDVVRWLLQHKAYPGEVNCLVYCVDRDDLDMLRELLQAGAKVTSEVDRVDLYTSVHSAEAVRLLERYRCRPKVSKLLDEIDTLSNAERREQLLQLLQEGGALKASDIAAHRKKR